MILYHGEKNKSIARAEKSQSAQKTQVHKAAFERKNNRPDRQRTDQKIACMSEFAHLFGNCKIFAKAIDKRLSK